MPQFHLRPVSELTRSTSPSTSTSTTSDRTPPPTHHLKPSSAMTSPQVVSPTQTRRPLSPLPLRDVDLTQRRDVPRRYPPPPTGHDLMALFPPAPPSGICTGPTSGYFQREERAFFAQAGREIVRVSIEVDMQETDAHLKAKSRDHPSTSRSWPPHTPLPPPMNYHHSPEQHSPGVRTPTTPFPPPPQPQHSLPSDTQMTRRPPVSVTTQPVFPLQSRGSPYPVTSPLLPNSHPPPPQHYMHTPSHEHPYPITDPMRPEHHDDPDEAWRRPMPHSQRRRAGKHTKRVVVK